MYGPASEHPSEQQAICELWFPQSAQGALLLLAAWLAPSSMQGVLLFRMDGKGGRCAAASAFDGTPMIVQVLC